MQYTYYSNYRVQKPVADLKSTLKLKPFKRLGIEIYQLKFPLLYYIYISLLM